MLGTLHILCNRIRAGLGGQVALVALILMSCMWHMILRNCLIYAAPIIYGVVGGQGNDYLDYVGGCGVPNWAKVDYVICARSPIVMTKILN